MKSRRHRAIEKVEKEVFMFTFNKNKVNGKKIKKKVKEGNLQYYKEMKLKLKDKKTIMKYYGLE